MATLADDVRNRAFERMYERYARDVYRYVLAVLRNPADAEDVTQTTFMNAYRAFKRGERPHKPQNWLITIAHNACRTKAITASRRPREVPLDDLVGQLSVPESERPNVRELLKALGRLPFNQRAAIAMRELEGRSYQEIAETLDVTVPAVEALIVRARRTLRSQRAAVRGLTIVQLPRSLRSLFELSDATTAVAGGLIGGGVFAKAAALLVAGLVAGGIAYTGVEAGIGGGPAPARVEPRPHVAPAAARSDAAAAMEPAASPTARPAKRRKRPEPTATAKQMPVAPVTPITRVEAATPGVATPVLGAVPIPDAASPLPEPERQQVRERRRHADHTASQVDKIISTVTGPATVPPLPLEPPALPLPAVPTVPSPPALPAVQTLPDVPVPPVEIPKLPDLPPLP